MHKSMVRCRIGQTVLAVSARLQETSKPRIQILLALILLSGANLCFANPEGGVVAHGQVNIESPQNGMLQVTQTSNNAIVNWSTFNIAAHEHTHFQQPIGGVTLNRVDAKNGMSEILGQLSASGTVVLVNPAGIMFGTNAKVDVTGIIASTADISDQNFMQSKYIFDQAGQTNAAIINKGAIHAKDHGLVALVGYNIRNDGLIQAKLGKVVLAHGEKFTIDMYGDQLINFTINAPANMPALDNISIQNSGIIQADGSDVLLTAQVAENVLDQILNMNGIIEANSIAEHNGKIIFHAGDYNSVNISGKVSASNTSGNGGEISIFGKEVVTTPEATLDASGSTHGGKIILKSKQATYGFGSAFVRASEIGGTGGAIEYSSDGIVDFAAHKIDTRTMSNGIQVGATGSFLLDPQFLIVQTTGGTAYLAGINNQFGSSPTATTTLTPASLNNASLLANVIIQANTDIQVVDPITLSNGTNSLTMQAGRSVLIQNAVSTSNGIINITANDNVAQSANRLTTSASNPPGDTETVAGNIVMSGSGSLSSGTAALNLTVGTSNVAPFSSGTMTLLGLTSGALTINNPNGATASSSISATTLTKQGAGMLTLSAANTISTSISVTAGTLRTNHIAGLAATSTPIAVTAGATLELNFSSATLSNTGTITLNGTGVGGAGAIALAGNSITISNPLTISTATTISGVGTGVMTFGGTATGAANANLTYSLANSGLALSTITLAGTGTLTVSAGGAITQTGLFTVPGVSSFTAGANAITLTQNNLLTGAITLNNSGANNVSLTNARATILATSTVGQNLTITATGALTQTGVLTVPGTSTFTNGAFATTLTQSNQFTGAVSFTNTGANAVAITNGRALIFGTSNTANNLTTIVTGALTQTGVLTVGGTASFTVGTNPITLTQNNLITGAITLSNSGANDVSLTNARATILAASTVGQNLTITATGALTQTGILTVPGTSTFTNGAFATTLTQNNVLTGAVFLTNTGANAVSLTNNRATLLGTSSVGQNLTINSVGALTQNGILTVPGTSSFTVGAFAMTLTQNNVLTGAITLSNSGANNVSLTNNNATLLAVSTVGQNLIITSVGAITQNGILTIPGTANISSGAFPITLGLNNLITGGITLSNSGANAVSLTNNRATILDPSTVGQNLSITAAGALTQTGVLTVPGTSTFTNGAFAITLTQSNLFTGAVSFTNTGANAVAITNGQALLFSTSSTANNLTAIATGAITQSGVLTIGGTANFTAGANPITLTQNNVITGAITLSNSGANDVSLTNNRATVLAASTVGQNLTVISNGALTQTGVLTVPGTSSFTAGAFPITLSQNNAFTGAIAMSNSGANNATLTNTLATILATSTVGQNYTITSGGSITQTGVLTNTGPTLNISLTTAGTDILLTQANDLGTTAPVFAGTLANIRDVSITNVNAGAAVPILNTLTSLRNLTLNFANAAIALPAATLTSSGSLSITAGGAITQSGVLTVPGTSSFTTSAFAITLTQNNLFTGAVSLTNTGANNVSLTNNRATVLGASSVGQNLTVTSVGALTQTGVLTVPGTSSFTAGAFPITLTQNNILTGAVAVSNSGANDASITNTLATVLATSTVGQNYFIVSGGSITQTGILTNTGPTVTMSLTTPSTDILLTQANNLGTAAPVFAGTLGNIRDISITNVNAGAATPSFTGLTSLRNLTLNYTTAPIALPAATLTNSGILTITAGGAITQSGVLTVPGTSTFTTAGFPITLTQNNLFTGAVSFTNTGANAVSITNAQALVLGTSSTGNNLIINATGAITQTGILTVTGTSSFTAGANAITLTQNNLFTGAVSLNNSGANNVSLINNRATVLGTSTLGQNFSLNSAGIVTQTGILTVPGTSSFTSNAFAMTLTQNNVLTGAITLSNSGANAVSLTNNTATLLVASTVGQNLIVTSVGAITQNGILTVPGTSSFSAGAFPITLTQNNVLTGAVTLSNSGANDVSLTNNLATVLAASTLGRNLTVVSNGAITQTGVLTVPGTSSFTAGAFSITLTQNNVLTGAIAVSNSGANDVSLTNTLATILATSTVGRNYNIISGGSITQIGALTNTSPTLTMTLTTAGTDILLTQANDLGTTAPAFGGTLTNIRDVSITNVNAGAAVPSFTGLTNLRNLTLNFSAVAIALPAITLTNSGSMSITAGGAITQSGILTVPGTSGFITGAFAITLTQNNLFTGAVSLTNTGANNVSLTNNRATVLGASSVGQNLTVTSVGALTQTGVLTVPGTLSFTAGAFPITLTQNNILTGAVAVSNSGANDASITNTLATVLATSTVGQNYFIVSGGSITQTGILTNTGPTVTMSLTSPNSDILLTQANNLGTAAPVFAGTLGNIRDISITNVNAGAATPSFTGLTSLRNLTLNYTTAPIALPAATLTNSGVLTITAGGAITQSGVLIVPGTSTFTTTGFPITLTQNNLFTGAVSFTNTGANAVSITNAQALVLGTSSTANNLTVNATGAITQTGILTVTGTSSFTAGANAITLGLNNLFTGAVSLNNSGANNVSLVNNIATVLATSTLGQNLTVTSNGALTQTGILTVPGTSSFTAGANSITLTQNNVLTGAITLSNSGTNNVSLINNRATLLAASTLGQNLTVTSVGAITQNGILTVPGTSSFSAGANPITLTQNNVLTGAITLSNSGANDVSLTNNRATVLAASTVGQNLTVTSVGALTQTGVLTVPGTSNFTAGAFPITLTQNNVLTGAITLSNSGANDVSLTNTLATVLAASTLGQNFTLISGGSVTQTGALITTGGTLTISTTVASSDILLTQANNLGAAAPVFSGTLANIRDVSITNINAGAAVPVLNTLASLRNLTLNYANAAVALPAATLTSAGSLVITAGGAITQSGVLTVPGTSTFTTAGFPITLTQNNLFTGAVSFTNTGSNAVSITNAQALVLGASSTGNNLTVNATGTITQTGILTVTGTSSFTAGANPITLGSNNLFTGAVSLNNSGANNVLLVNNIATVLGTSTLGQNLTVTSNGALTQTGILTVPGISSFTAGANAITLTQNNALTGAITLSNSGANNVSLTNNRATLLAASTVGQNLTVTSVGAITQNGILTVPGASSFTAGANPITLTQNNLFTGAISLSNSGTNDVSVTNNRATILATSTLGRNLTVISVGALTQTGVLTVPGTSSFTAGAFPITLTQNNVLTGAITLSNSGANDVSLTNTLATVLTASTLGQNFTIITGGALTQTGALTLTGGTLTMSATTASTDILLTQANNLGTSAPVFSGTLGNIRDISITNVNAGAAVPVLNTLTSLRNLTLNYANAAVALPTATLTSAGSLVIAAGGAITQSGVLTVPGTSSFTTAGFPITLTQNNLFAGAVSFTNTGANAVSITNAQALVLGTSSTANNLTVNATGAITQTGILTITGTSSFTAGANPITLGSNNLFTGTVSLNNSGANNVSLVNNIATVLGASTLGQNLTVTSNGALTQTGILTVPGTSSFTAAANAITLTQNNVLTGAITLSNSGANNVSLTNNIATLLATSTAGQNLTVTSAGAITQNGILTVPGTSSFSAGANPITLTQNNVLTGAITFSNSGANDVSLTNNRATVLAASTLGRNLTVVSNGALTQTGVLTIPGTSSFTAGAFPITMTQNNVLTGAITLSNSGTNDVSLTNTLATVLATSTLGQNFTIITGGAITQTGTLTLTNGTLTISATAASSDILLTQANNLGAAAPVFSGTLANIRDVSITNVNAGAAVPVINTLTNLRNLTLNYANAAVALPAATLTSAGSLVVTAGGAITQSGILTVPGTSTFTTAGFPITLTQNNLFTGAVSFTNTGANAVSITNAQALVLGTSSTANNLTVNATGAITQTGILTVTGTSSFTAGANAITLGSNNLFTGAISLNNSGVNNVSLVNNIATVLSTSTLGQNLTVTSNGAITQTGILTVPGTSNFTAGTFPITLTQNNVLTGAITLSNSGANNVSLTNNQATVLAASTVGQNLTVTSVGAITQNGILTVPGTSSFSAGANPINLTQNNLLTGAISLSNSGANDVSLTNNSATVLAASTVGQNLTIAATGALTQTGILTVPGTSNFSVGANQITLTQNNVLTGAVTLNNSGANDVSVTDTTPLLLAASTIGRNLTLVSGGSITQSGILTLTGTLTISSSVAASDIILTSLNNLGANAPIFNGTVANIRDVLLTNLNAGATAPNLSTLTSLRNLSLTFSNSAIALPAVTLINSGAMTLTAGGAITQTGAFIVPGTATFNTSAFPITLTQSNLFSGAVSVNNTGNNNISLTNNQALTLGASTVGNNLIVVNNGGIIDQIGILQAAGSASFTNGAFGINLSQNNIITGAVDFTNSGSNDVQFTNTLPITLNTSNIGKDFTLISNGSITEIGATTATGGTLTISSTAANSDILLTQANNFINTPVFAGTLSNIRDVSITNINASASFPDLTPLSSLRNLTLNYPNAALDLAALTLNGSLSLTAGGAITQTGPFTVQGTSYFNASSNPIVLTQNNSLMGEISLNTTGTNDVSLINVVNTVLSSSTIGQNLSVISTGSLAQTGVLTVPGTSTLTSINNNIDLSANNVLTGAITLTTNTNASLTNTIATILDTSTIGQDFTLISGGSVTQTGVLTVATGTLDISSTAPNSDIILTQNNDLGTIAPVFTDAPANIRDLSLTNINVGATAPDLSTLTSIRNLNLNFANAAIDLPAVTLNSGGIMALSAGDAITQTGLFIVPGTSSFTTGAFPITLTQSNVLTGAITLSNSGANDVSLTNNHATVLAASTVGRDLTISSNGALTQTGILTVPGVSSFTAGADLITLTQNNLLTGAITLSNSGANDVSLSNNQATSLAASTIGRNLSVNSNGPITQTGILTVPGTASFIAGSSPITLTQNNLFTGAVSLSNSGTSNVAITNNQALILGTSTIANDLVVIANGALTQTGVLTVPGTSNFSAGANPITLTQSNILTGAISVSNSGANDVSITNSTATVLGTVSLGQNLTVASNGALTQTSILTIPGTSSFSAGNGPITLTQNNLFTGAITLSNSSANNVSLTNNRATILAASTIGQNLTLVSNGAITQTGILTVPGTSNFSAGANSITLTQSNMLTGAVSLSNSGTNDVSVTNNTATVLGTVSLGQNLIVASNGALTQTSILTIPGTSNFSAGNASITLPLNNLFTGAIALSNSGANDVSLTNNQATVLAASTIGQNLTLSSNGAITQTGLLTVPGVSSFTAGANPITLTQSNMLTGAISLSNSGTNDVSVTNNTATILDTISLGQNLTVSSNGALTQTSILTIPGTSNFSAGNGSITLPLNNLFTGAIALSNSGANDVSLTNDQATILATSAVGRNLIINSNGPITQTGILTVPGTASFVAGSSPITLTQNNLFTGAVSLSNNGTSNVAITNNQALILGTSTIANDLVVIANGALTQTGVLTVPGISNFSAGANPITLTQNNVLTGAISLSNSGSNNVSVTNSTATILGTISLGQNLTVTSNGALTQTSILTIPGTSSFSAGNGPITLPLNNLFTGAITINNSGANNVSLTNNRATVLATSTVGQNITVSSNGALTQTGVLTVPGTSNFNAGANPITLTQSNMLTGAVSLSNSGTNDVSVINNTATILGTVSLGQNLSVSSNGALTQTSILTIPGTSNFSAGNGPITLPLNNLFTGAIALNNSGANDVSLTNDQATILATSAVGHNLTINSNGAITQTGILTVPGVSSFTAGANPIILTQSNMLTGAISVSNSGANDVSVTNNTATILGTISLGQNLTVTSNGALTQTSILTIPGTASFSAGNGPITLPLNNLFTGAIALSNSGANDVNITNDQATIFAASTIGRNLSVNSNGPITQTDILTVPGTASFVAGSSSITLTQNNLFTGAVSLSNSGTSNVAITNDQALVLGTSTIANDLVVIANGALTQTGVLTVPGTSNFSAGPNPITLTQNNVLTGAISVSNSGANDVSITNSTATVLGTVSLGQNLTVASNGALTQTSILTIPGTASFSAGNGPISLPLNNLFTGAIALSNSGANDVSLTNNQATVLATSTVGQNITVSSNGALTQTGILAVSGTSNFSAGANPITLTQSNMLTGAISVSNSGANDVSVTNNTATILGTVSLGQNLNVSANGALTQTSILTIPGTSSFSAGNGPITLPLNNLFTGAIALSNGGANNVSLTNNRATILATSTIGQNLTLASSGAITQTGVLTVPGTSNFSAGANTITLTQNNVLSGGITLNNSGTNDVSVTNNHATILAASTVGQNLTVSAIGALTQTGILTVPGTSSFDAGANPITLTQNNVLTGAITLSNSGTNNVSVSNNTATILATASLGQNLTITSNGAITQTGILTIPGTSSFNAGANAITLTQNNLFTGAIALTNSGANNVSLTNNRATNLAVSTVGQNLTLTSNGAITQTGILTIPGISSFTAGANPITLTQNNLLTGAMTLSNSGGNDVSLTNNRATIMAGSTVGRNLALISNGALTQTGVLIVPGTSSFAAGSNPITLSQNNLLTGAIALSNSGANDVTLINNRATILGTSTIGHNLNVTANGALTQTGATTVPGTSIFTTGAFPIALTQNNALTGLVTVSNSGANDVSLTNTLATALPTTIFGRNFTLISGGSVTQTGPFTLTNGTLTLSSTAANSDILLNQTNNLGTAAPVFTGTLGNIRDVALTNTNAGATMPILSGLTSLRNLTLNFANAAMVLPTATLTNSGSISATAGGAITQSGILTVPGTASFSTGNQPITLTQNNMFTGAVTLNNTGANNVAITNNRALSLSTSNIGRNLTVLTNGNLSQAGTLTVNGAANFNAGAGNVNFANLLTIGNTDIVANNATGNLNVGGLQLTTNFANLFGSVAGLTGQDAVAIIVNTNFITQGTHYFDNIDMYNNSPRPPEPTNNSSVITPSLQIIVANQLFVAETFWTSQGINNIENSYYEMIESEFVVTTEDNKNKKEKKGIEGSIKISEVTFGERLM